MCGRYRILKFVRDFFFYSCVIVFFYFRRCFVFGIVLYRVREFGDVLVIVVGGFIEGFVYFFFFRSGEFRIFLFL